jgi:hypothetical protein
MVSENFKQENSNEANASSQEPLNNSEMKNVENADETAQTSESGNEANASSNETVKDAVMTSKKKELTEEQKKKQELKKALAETAASIMMPVEVIEKDKDGKHTSKIEQRKFARIKGNRDIKDSDVHAFMRTIHSGNYENDYPIIVIEGTDLINNGYELVDLNGKPIIKEEATLYLGTVDGQHRSVAFSLLNSTKSPNEQICVPNVRIKRDAKYINNLREYLAQINMTGHNWNTKDKVRVSSMNTENKILFKINELMDNEIPASTAVKICTGKKLTTAQINKILRTGDTSVLYKKGTTQKGKKAVEISKEEITKKEPVMLKRANDFVNTCLGIVKIEVLKKRYYIDGFNYFSKSHSEDKAFEALSKLTKSDFTNISDDEDFVENLRKALDAA